jgi:D-arabinose 1-dehydrogenase-like Zn-dependent alcohol dehydrogenase
MSATTVAVGTMEVAQISKPRAGFQIVEREIPNPGVGQVRIKVNASGVCHSDALVVEGSWPGISYPRVPGHEIAGIVDAVGAGISEWKKGQRIAIGWHGGNDFTCPECRRGDFMNCRNQQVTGISCDGGYQEYMLAPPEALAAIPDCIRDTDAGPLMCAGITTYNSLRHSGALQGDLLVVQGIGGLGHLGVQFANKWLPGRRDWPRLRKCRARKETRGERVHQRRIRECRREVAENGWSSSDSGDGAKPQDDE